MYNTQFVDTTCVTITDDCDVNESKLETVEDVLEFLDDTCTELDKHINYSKFSVGRHVRECIREVEFNKSFWGVVDIIDTPLYALQHAVKKAGVPYVFQPKPLHEKVVLMMAMICW
jgi:hypothetical protein